MVVKATDALKKILQKILQIIGNLNNKSEIVVLWTNPNPQNSWPSGKYIDAAVDLNKIDYVIFIVRTATDVKEQTGVIAKAGQNAIVPISGWLRERTTLAHRPFSFDTSKQKYKAGSSTFFNDLDNSANNNYAIPYILLGIKLGGAIANLHHLFRRWCIC